MIGYEHDKNNRKDLSPENLFELAKIEEKNSNWGKASELYDLALDNFGYHSSILNATQLLKNEKTVLYFRLIINRSLCLIKDLFEWTDEYDPKYAISHIREIGQSRIKLLKVYPHLIHRFHALEKSFFKKLEEWLTEQGFLNEANQVYLVYQKLITTHLFSKAKINYQQKNFLEAINDILILLARYLTFRLYLGYGIQGQYMISSTIIIILTFGAIFTKFQCIEILRYKKSFIRGLYGSVMTFINFGFDEVAPITNLGRIFVNIEGLLGFITLGSFVAFFLRRMK